MHPSESPLSLFPRSVRSPFRSRVLHFPHSSLLLVVPSLHLHQHSQPLATSSHLHFLPCFAAVVQSFRLHLLLRLRFHSIARHTSVSLVSLIHFLRLKLFRPLPLARSLYSTRSPILKTLLPFYFATHSIPRTSLFSPNQTTEKKTKRKNVFLAVGGQGRYPR